MLYLDLFRTTGLLRTNQILYIRHPTASLFRRAVPCLPTAQPMLESIQGLDFGILHPCLFLMVGIASQRQPHASPQLLSHLKGRVRLSSPVTPMLSSFRWHSLHQRLRPLSNLRSSANAVRMQVQRDKASCELTTSETF